MTARAAGLQDVAQMALLADAKRREYEPHAPVFWRPAPDALEIHRPWLSQLVEDPAVGAFVHEADDGIVDGFLVVTVLPAPPVYDPGGLSSLIDDFAVSHPERWATAGAALLRIAMDWAHQNGAVQVVVVCGPHDGPKRALLEEFGLYVASEWFTTPLSR